MIKSVIIRNQMINNCSTTHITNFFQIKISQNKTNSSNLCLANFMLILTIVSSFACLSQQTVETEDTMKFYDYATHFGYPVEQHIIKTSDNYRLKFFRIQQKNTSIQQLSGKPVVYLQHGLLSSSDTFIINEESLAPAFVFANKGFDVWVGNNRGNRYSSKDLSPDVKDFWNFSFDQMTKYDLPAAFKYIVQKTQQKIHYIGHSQGTLIMFIALSEKYAGVQEYLLSFNAWGPIVYLSNIKTQIMEKLATGTGQLSGLSFFKQHFFGYLPILQFTQVQRAINAALCRATPKICNQLLTQVSQSSNTVNNMKIIPVIAGHQPSGTSLKNLYHFQQYANTAIFRKYDYGDTLANQIKYGFGQLTPPNYDLSKITFPYVNLLVGTYDKLATVADAERIWAQMINAKNRASTILNYGHFTFVWGKQNTHIDLSIQFMRRSLSGQ